MSETQNIDPSKIIESLMRQISELSQQKAMLQAIIEQAVVREDTPDDLPDMPESD